MADLLDQVKEIFTRPANTWTDPECKLIISAQNEYGRGPIEAILEQIQNPKPAEPQPYVLSVLTVNPNQEETDEIPPDA